MSAGKWMVHIDLACGSVEYMGEEPPAGALARVLGDLARAGLVPARGGGENADAPAFLDAANAV
ncbi:MAG: hypothetical protein Q4G55_07065 [bacterium]|nr:hypothetical protein [bacterium]